MKKEYKDLIRLALGLFLYALGMVLGYEAKLGYAPWEVFHVGLAETTGLTIGTANIIVGLVVLAFVVYEKEALGLGSILNMVLVGVFFDLILFSGLIPTAKGLTMSLIYVALAMIVISFATYYYVSAGYGAGPRDSLLIYLSRRFRISIGGSRRILEVLVTLLGYLLGGMVGLGTVIFALVTGYIMEFIFKLVDFDPRAVEHRLLKDKRMSR